jgi:hypothetical protein
MLVNLETVDDETFIDLYLTKKELNALVSGDMISAEKEIFGRAVHVGICAPHVKEDDEQ